MWRPRAWQRGQAYDVQVGDPLPWIAAYERNRELRWWLLHQHVHLPSCLGLSQRSLGDSSTHSPFPWPWDEGQGPRHAELCSQGKACCAFLPGPQKPGRWEDAPQVPAHWSQVQQDGVEGAWVGVGVCVCVCAWASSLKNLLLVCNSSHITSAEIRVHQRQPRDDKSPEGLQRGFWASTSGITRSISLQVKWKTMTISFVCKIIKLSFHHCKIPEFPWRKQRAWEWGMRQARAKNGWFIVFGVCAAGNGFPTPACSPLNGLFLKQVVGGSSSWVLPFLWAQFTARDGADRIRSWVEITLPKKRDLLWLLWNRVFQEYPWRVRLAREIAIPEWLHFFWVSPVGSVQGALRFFSPSQHLFAES